MLKTSLLTLAFFIITVVANAYAESTPMEKEIVRHLDQIQKIGIPQWGPKLIKERKRLEQQETKSQNRPQGNEYVFNRE